MRPSTFSFRLPHAIRPARPLLLFAVASVLTAASTTARAQVLQLYATFDVAHVANAESGFNNLATPGGSTENFTSFTTPGLLFGATVNTSPHSLFSVGVDIRGNMAFGTPGHAFLFEGLKFTARPRRLKFTPYFEVAVTANPGHTRVANTSTGPVYGDEAQNPLKIHYYAYQGYLGADRHIAPHLDWRIVEIGGGTSVGSGHNGITLLTAGTGLVACF